MMFAATIGFSSVPDGIVASPIDPVFAWCVVLGSLLMSTIVLWVLGRPDAKASRKPGSGPKAQDFAKAA